MEPIQFSKISSYLTHPLVLVGFALFLMISLFQLIIKTGLIPPLTQAQGTNVLRIILHYGFIGSITVIILGFGLQYYNNRTIIAENENKKAVSALDAVLLEVGNNIINLTSLINSIETTSVGNYTKNNPRRVNETELSYRERINNQYRDYQNYVNQFYDLFPIKQDAFQAYRNVLAPLKNNSLGLLEKIYESISLSNESIFSYKNDVSHCISLNYSDAEASSYLHSQILIRSASAKNYLCETYSNLCRLAIEYPNVLLSHVPTNFEGIHVAADANQARLFAEKGVCFLREKSDEYAKLSNKLKGAKLRDVERRISDPFLLYIRKLNGLGGELSEANVWSLEKKELSPEKNDPKTLLHLVYTSFIEGDGQFTKIYLERMKSCSGISSEMMRWVEASINRIENPDMFGESLGIMVMEIEKDGLFDKAGIFVGDIIYELNGSPIHEPEEISRALGWTSEHSFLLTIFRDKKTITKPITPGRSAGALTLALITFYQSRL